jgi:hypothetical protein
MKFSYGVTLPSQPKKAEDLKDWSKGLHGALHQTLSPIARRLNEMIVEGPAASLPAAAGSKRFYYSDDEDALYYDAGAAGWLPVAKDTASLEPGHKHSKLWASDGDPQAVFIDAVGNVGIGATPVSAKLEVSGNIIASSDIHQTKFINTSSTIYTNVSLLLYCSHVGDTTTKYMIHSDKRSSGDAGVANFNVRRTDGGDNNLDVLTYDAVNNTLQLMAWYNGSLSHGNVGLGFGAFGTNAVRNFGIAIGTAPTTAPADIMQMWVEDVNGAAGYAGLHKMTETTAQKEVVPGVIIKTSTGRSSNPYEGLMEINTVDNQVYMYADGGWRILANATW